MCNEGNWLTLNSKRAEAYAYCVINEWRSVFIKRDRIVLNTAFTEYRVVQNVLCCTDSFLSKVVTCVMESCMK